MNYKDIDNNRESHSRLSHDICNNLFRTCLLKRGITCKERDFGSFLFLIYVLYLIRSFGRGGKSIVKVGYTGALDQRLGNYRVENPLFELIAIRQGTMEDELRLQMYISALGYKADILCEWFQDSPEVLTQFHAGRSKIDKVLWKNRDALFLSFDDQRKRKIYEELRQGKGSEIRGKAEREYLRVRGMEYLREVNSEYLDPDLLGMIKKKRRL